MTDLFATVGKLAPVVLVFGGGVVFARRKIIGADASKAFSEFAFLFAIPCYLFGSLYASDLGRLFDVRGMLAYLSAAVIAMALVAVGARRVLGADARATALRIMATVQVNTTYFAIPVFVLLFGDASPIFPTILLQVCVFTVVVVAVMESGAGHQDQDVSAARAVLRGVRSALTTPLVLACYLGIGANLLHVPAPGPLLAALSFTGAAAAPVALFAFGLHLGGSGLRWRGATRDEYALIAIKCLAMPLLVFALCVGVFRVENPWLSYLVLTAAMPAPQNLFVFAQRYDADVDLAASVVAKTTLAALALIPLWLLVTR
ncbi:AEC family transporter [Nocardia callitridis]|uniref:AEC family transporter n=1 Tax=Nocardia callitridis TaxID=648753 RepID=A0ABP9KIG2_9NOCA